MSALACTAVAGCIVEHHYDAPLDTQIEFSEAVNVGACGDANVFSWTVTNRETGDTGTAACGQPVLFPHLAPDTAYTFDVVGYQGSHVCWQGSCAVDTRYGVLTEADCSSQIAHLCGI